jgi:hypothetical protein
MPLNVPLMPKLSLRDLFAIVTIVALALGWAIDRDRLRVNYNTHLNAVMAARHREDELRRAVQSEGYEVRWDAASRSFKLLDWRRDQRGQTN